MKEVVNHYYSWKWSVAQDAYVARNWGFAGKLKRKHLLEPGRSVSDFNSPLEVPEPVNPPPPVQSPPMPSSPQSGQHSDPNQPLSGDISGTFAESIQLPTSSPISCGIDYSLDVDVIS